MDPDATQCFCFHVTRRKIVNFIRRERPRRASQVSECFGAGTGCGWCIPYLIELHEQIVGDEAVESDDITPADYEAMRREYQREVGRGERTRNQYGDPRPPDELDFDAPDRH
ncbi:MAG: (2Fe-2S)-binding protein [Planctomycetota bacterium]